MLHVNQLETVFLIWYFNRFSQSLSDVNAEIAVASAADFTQSQVVR